MNKWSLVWIDDAGELIHLNTSEEFAADHIIWLKNDSRKFLVLENLGRVRGTIAVKCESALEEILNG